MQANTQSARNTRVRYAYRANEEDEQETSPANQQQAEDAPSDEQEETISTVVSSGTKSSHSWPDDVNAQLGSVLKHIIGKPALAGGLAGALAAAGIVAAVIASAAKRSNPESKGLQQKEQHLGAGDSSSSSKATRHGKVKAAAGNVAAEPAAPGPNSKVKSTRTCVPLADGSAVVMLRPIAADNSCLFNAVGYCMHHSTNRAPFLRQVVSREVSSDPQEYSAAFLGMDNTAYCNWITNPAHWGGGIELAILAAHYRREIAAWNLATGACHVFGEEKGYTKQVMVIYNGVHYDALAVAASPRAEHDDDVTEFNPRTKRGKMILAAASQLVKLHLKGKPTHHEQQQQKKQEEKAARKAAKRSGSRADAAPSGEEPAESSSSSVGGAVAGQQLLACGSCGEQLQSMEAAKSHAAATGHTEYKEVVAV